MFWGPPKKVVGPKWAVLIRWAHQGHWQGGWEGVIPTLGSQEVRPGGWRAPMRVWSVG